MDRGNRGKRNEGKWREKKGSEIERLHFASFGYQLEKGGKWSEGNWKEKLNNLDKINSFDIEKI